MLVPPPLWSYSIPSHVGCRSPVQKPFCGWWSGKAISFDPSGRPLPLTSHFPFDFWLLWKMESVSMVKLGIHLRILHPPTQMNSPYIHPSLPPCRFRYSTLPMLPSIPSHDRTNGLLSHIKERKVYRRWMLPNSDSLGRLPSSHFSPPGKNVNAAKVRRIEPSDRKEMKTIASLCLSAADQNMSVGSLRTFQAY